VDFAAEVEYSEEQEKFAQEVRAWIDENVPKDLVSPRDPVKVTHEQWLQRREIGRKLGKKGWLHPRFPREYGGGGLSADQTYVLYREFGERHISIPPYHDAGGGLGAAAILAVGTDEQKKRLLPPILTGEAATWELFTEPEAGTDEANQQTNALRMHKEGEYFIVNGQKIFVGGLWEPPEQFLLLSRSDLEAPRHQNLAMFVCSAREPGVTIQRLDLFVPGMYTSIMGQAVDAAEGMKYTVFFDDVKIHEDCLVCGDHDGWKVTSATLAVEHGVTARPGTGTRARSIRIPKNLVAENFLAQCKNNPRINQRLKENPHLIDRVVDAYIGAQLERLFSIRNFGGRGGAYGGPQSQIFSKIYAIKLSSIMSDVLSHYAFTDSEEWWLDEGIFEVGQRGSVCISPAGTPEAMKIVMSRGLAIGR